ncbi:MAG TPA: flagellar export protein FliJ [Syntrophomonadaceae bacterium]|nr:flagellar export protein FliJ [Syntrophomonadaceae bacterium]
MKAFVFRLQTSLNVSLRWEQLAREGLQACLAEKERLEKELEQIQEKLGRMEDYIRELGICNSLAPDVLIYREYLPLLHNQIRNLQGSIVQAEEKVEEARALLLGRRRETQSLERLREKEWQDYLHELGLEEQKIIDEVATNAHYRKSRGEDDPGIDADHSEQPGGIRDKLQAR